MQTKQIHKRIILALSIALMGSCSSLLSMSHSALNRAAISAFRDGLFSACNPRNTVECSGSCIDETFMQLAHKTNRFLVHHNTIYKVIADFTGFLQVEKVCNIYPDINVVCSNSQNINLGDNIIIGGNLYRIIKAQDSAEHSSLEYDTLTHPKYIFYSILGISTGVAAATALITHIYNKKYTTKYSKEKIAACAWLIAAAGSTFYFYH